MKILSVIAITCEFPFGCLFRRCPARILAYSTWITDRLDHSSQRMSRLTDWLLLWYINGMCCVLVSWNSYLTQKVPAIVAQHSLPSGWAFLSLEDKVRACKTEGMKNLLGASF